MKFPGIRCSRPKWSFRRGERIDGLDSSGDLATQSSTHFRPRSILGEYFRPGLVSQVFRRACPSGSSQVNDTIEVPGVGEETVTLDGTYRIQRSQPTTPDWETSTIDVKMLDLDVLGTSKLFGRIQVRLNPTKETVGKVQGSGKAKRPKPCSFKAYIQMTLLDRDTSPSIKSSSLSSSKAPFTTGHSAD